MLQCAGDERAENGADARDPEFHSNRGGAHAGLVGSRGKVVQHELRADDEEAGGRNRRDVDDVIIHHHEGEHRDAADRPPGRDQPAAAAGLVDQMPEHESADERHDLHQRAKAEAGRKGFSTLHHHGRNPARQAEDAEQAEECRRPDCKRGPAIFGLEQHSYRIDRLLLGPDGNFGRLVDIGPFGAKLGQHVADFVDAPLKCEELR